jgi:uncharacterized membrane protein YqiK
LENLIFYGSIVGITAVVLLVLGLLLTRLYRRASKEQAFVRTGLGGQLVVKDGGALILPVFHDTTPINMKTLVLQVTRRDTDALITKDSLRVDVTASFFVKVKPDSESIAMAAQSLGQSTLDPSKLSTLVEGKFVDALRSVAASMDMQDLHQKRGDFVQQVQNTVAEDLIKNGLELESVSLTGLDQTDMKHLNPENAFDAVGLAKLKSITEARRKERNDTEADTRVAIEQKNLEASKRSLEIARDQELASLEQERMLGTQRAEQEAQLAGERARRTQESETARIETEQATAQTKIAAEQETARKQVEQKLTVSQAEIASRQALEIAEQNRNIAVAEKSQAESEARARADKARAEAVKAAEAVTTVQATAIAERTKAVALVNAEQKAQEEATGIRIRAEADLAAADAQAQARERLAEATAKDYQVEADGKRAIFDAANQQSAEQVALQLKLAITDAMPKILEQMVKPVEAVDSIKVVNFGGMGGGIPGVGFGGGESSPQAGGDLASQITDAALRYRLQSPMADQLGALIGMDLSQGMGGITQALDGVTGDRVASVPVAKTTRKSSDRPLTENEKDELRRLAGIAKPSEDAA